MTESPGPTSTRAALLSWRGLSPRLQPCQHGLGLPVMVPGTCLARARHHYARAWHHDLPGPDEPDRRAWPARLADLSVRARTPNPTAEQAQASVMFFSLLFGR